MKRDEDPGCDEADVPEIIYALASVMHDAGIPTSTAVRMAAEMLKEAMDEPDSFYEFVTIH